MHVCVYACVYTCVCMHVCVCMSSITCIFVYVCVCECIYIYIYIYIQQLFSAVHVGCVFNRNVFTRIYAQITHWFSRIHTYWFNDIFLVVHVCCMLNPNVCTYVHADIFKAPTDSRMCLHVINHVHICVCMCVCVSTHWLAHTAPLIFSHWHLLIPWYFFSCPCGLHVTHKCMYIKMFAKHPLTREYTPTESMIFF